MGYDSGLVGYWRFNEGTGSIGSSAIPGAINGSLNNGTKWVVGRLGSGVEFGGPNATTNVSVGSQASRTNSTFMCWIYAYTSGTTTPQALCILQSTAGNTNSAGFSTSLQPQMWTNNWQTGNGSILLNTWNHYVMMGSSNGSAYFYLNGSLDSSFNTTFTSCTGFTLGARDDSSVRTMSGILDDVRWYSYTLTLGSIQQIYNDGVGSEYASGADAVAAIIRTQQKFIGGLRVW